MLCVRVRERNKPGPLRRHLGRLSSAILLEIFSYLDHGLSINAPLQPGNRSSTLLQVTVSLSKIAIMSFAPSTDEETIQTIASGKSIKNRLFGNLCKGMCGPRAVESFKYFGHTVEKDVCELAEVDA